MKITTIEPIDRSKVKLKVAAYCRVSTEADEQENSLENQKDYYEQYIRSNKKYEFAGIYHDFGISGFKENRPGFQRMIEDAMHGKIDLILTKSISRFARNTVTMLKVVRQLKSVGVGIFLNCRTLTAFRTKENLCFPSMLLLHRQKAKITA